jgi:hypothetical protein
MSSMTNILPFPATRSSAVIWRTRVDRVSAEMRRLSPVNRLAYVNREKQAVSAHLRNAGCGSEEIREQLDQFTAAVSRKFNGIGDGLKTEPFASRPWISPERFDEAHQPADQVTTSNPNTSGPSLDKLSNLVTTPDDDGPRAA